jgi:hypothetical protein
MVSKNPSACRTGDYSRQTSFQGRDGSEESNLYGVVALFLIDEPTCNANANLSIHPSIYPAFAFSSLWPSVDRIHIHPSLSLSTSTIRSAILARSSDPLACTAPPSIVYQATLPSSIHQANFFLKKIAKVFLNTN